VLAGQHVPLDFTRGRPRQRFFTNRPTARNLEVRELITAQRFEGFCLNSAPRLRDDEGVDDLAPLVVRLSYDSCLKYSVRGEQHALLLGRVDVESSADDHLLGAAGNMHVALVVDHGQISGAHPPVDEGLSRRLGLAVVTNRACWGKHDYLTDVTDRNIRERLVHYADLRYETWLARGPRFAYRILGGQVQHQGRELTHPIALQQEAGGYPTIPLLDCLDRHGLRDLVSNGTLTKDQVMAVITALKALRPAKPMSPLDSRLSSVLSSLVAKGTITQAQADAVIAAKPTREAKGFGHGAQPGSGQHGHAAGRTR